MVHPPVGKWLIALGIKLFGDHEFGWRIASALAGSLVIYFAARIALRIFHDKKWAILTAALMALDGLGLVMSRTALLDIFVTLFALLAINAWLAGNYLRLAIYLGLAMGSKWSGIYFLIAILLLEFLVNRNLRLAIKTALIASVVYVLSWMGWFISNSGWDRHRTSNVLTSFIYYHKEILGFHTGLTQKHPYQANPWSWIVMGRPTSFYYQSPKGCGSASCSQEVIAIGTPILWWIGTAAVIFLIGYNLHNIQKKRLELSVIIPILGILAGYFPWFLFQKRTVFTFYAIVFEPFLVLAVVLLAKTAYDYDERFKYVIYVVLGLVALNFWSFYPILVGKVITYKSWYSKMWWKSWI